jgi:hypothetical protein
MERGVAVHMSAATHKAVDNIHPVFAGVAADAAAGM